MSAPGLRSSTRLGLSFIDALSATNNPNAQHQAANLIDHAAGADARRRTGTTVNTVRHYHRRAVLDEPERAPNGDKQYCRRLLMQLLHIRRPRDRGSSRGTDPARRWRLRARAEIKVILSAAEPETHALATIASALTMP
jgi:hypothetical protein